MEIGGVPLYVRLANLFRDNIVSNTWAPGHQLPTIPILCERYQVARVTVRKALQVLARDGLITSTQGRGTFVNPPHPDRPAAGDLRHAINDPLQTGPFETMKVLGRKTVNTLPNELAFSGDQYASYVRIHKVHFFKKQPFQVVDTFVAKPVYDRFPRGADRTSKTARLLRDHGGVQIHSSRQELTIAHANPEVANLLGCAVGSVLVRIRRWRTDQDDRLVYAALNLYRGDRFVLDITSTQAGAMDFTPGLIPISKTNGN